MVTIMARMIVFLSLFFLYGGCSTETNAPSPASNPIYFDKQKVESSKKIAVFVPGALSPIEMFSAVRTWEKRGYALAFYRFPGMNGMALDHQLNIEDASGRIAEFANLYPSKSIYLVGYSTGGPIAIRAAGKIERHVKVAAISSAVEHGGGVRTTLNAAYDFTSAFIRSKSFDRSEIAVEYFRTLLFGRKGLSDPSTYARSSRIVERVREHIYVPPKGMVAAHTTDLRRWKIPSAASLNGENLKFFIGLDDPIFRPRQIYSFAQEFEGAKVHEYPGHGHLLYFTHPAVFEDVLSFFEE